MPAQRVSGERWNMAALLVRAGCTLRRRNRADCAHCTGRSRATLSYTPEVAFCHRCRWSASRIALIRELGLTESSAAPEARHAARQRAEREALLAAFEVWRAARIREHSDHYRALGRQAVWAREVLRKFPDCEPAWEALRRFYAAEAKLSRALDFLTFAKASDWLERDATPAEVFQAWRKHVAKR